MAKWTNEDTLILKEFYSIDDKQSLIQKLNRGWDSIKLKARDLGLNRVEFSHLWSKEEDAALISDFPLGNRHDLESRFNRSWASIQHRASRLNVSRLIKGDANYVTDFFKVWSPSMAYVLGFIAADGCVYERAECGSKDLQIHLAIKDIDHLYKIRDLISPGRSIYITKGACRLSIGSNYMCNSLIDLGITPRKSLSIEFPQVPDQYRSHFIRGYFDGDGWITKRLNCVGFCGGSLEFLIAISNALSDATGVYHPNIIRSGGVFKLSYGRVNSLVPVCKFMYNDSSIHLIRKYDIYTNLLQKRDC
jgi:hypothetical protein